MAKRNCGRVGRNSPYAYPLGSREWYLEMFGLTPEEVFTPEELRRIDVLVHRDANKVGDTAK